jgi:hypothetical protein
MIVFCKHPTQRSGAMRDYRAYILGIDGHRFVWAKDFLAGHPNDAAAVDAARQLTNEHEVEVWEGCRLVARLSPSEKELLSPSEKELSPGLVPPLLKDSVGWADAISLSKVSELASASRSESNLSLPHPDNLQFVAESTETRTPALPENSADLRESATKLDAGPTGWRRFLVSWSGKHEPGD